MQRLQAVCLLCNTQRMVKLPESTVARLLERKDLSTELLTLAQTYSIDTMAQALVASLCGGSSDRINHLMDILPTLESCCGQVRKRNK